MTDDNPADAGVDSGLMSDVPVHRQANLDAVLYPPVSADDAAGVEVAGAYLGVSVTPDCELELSLELGAVAAWLRQADGTVRVRLVAGADTLLAADVTPPPPPSDQPGGPPRGKVVPLTRRRPGGGTPPGIL